MMARFNDVCWCLLMVLVGIGQVVGDEPRLPVREPGEVGMSSRRLSLIDDIVAEGLRDRKMPGCVVVVGRNGSIVYRRAFGHRRTQPTAEPMTLDTVFDLASLTKPVATATCLSKLIEEGKVDVAKPVSFYLPEFAANGKEAITVKHLLLHTSGLIPDNAMADYEHGPEEAWKKLLSIKPLGPVDQQFRYSDVNFLILGRIIEKVSGEPLNEFAIKAIFRPLGMADTGFRPIDAATKNDSLVARIAPTEKSGNTWLTGVVHDPRARALGGVAGHAGLFSTADDLSVFAQMLLNGGTMNRVRVLQQQTVEQLGEAHAVPPHFSRTLGWDHRSSLSGNRGDFYSRKAFGHGGFTGTALWIDPEQNLFVIFLSNRLHPTGDGVVNPLIARIGTVAAGSIQVGDQ